MKTMTFNQLSFLLRDTALIVDELTAVEQGVKSIYELRHRCEDAYENFSRALVELGMETIECQKATYAQCALLDEMALFHLPSSLRQIWAAQPLQVSYFGNYLAGEKVYSDLQEELSRAPPTIWLLQTYQFVLMLGFKGRYLLDGNSARQQLIDTLEATINRNQCNEPYTKRPISRWQIWLERYSGRLALFAWLVTGGVYAIFYWWLTLTVSHLVT